MKRGQNGGNGEVDLHNTGTEEARYHQLEELHGVGRKARQRQARPRLLGALSPWGFGLALGALRRRLRLGVDAPGAALPINLIAAELRLSSTPVREALSRLAGEDLVEKRGPAYTRPHLDGPALAELYHLRLLYLAAALAPDAERRAKHRQWPPRAPFRFAADLAEPGRDPAAIVEALRVAVARLDAAGSGVVEARLMADMDFHRALNRQLICLVSAGIRVAQIRTQAD